MGYSPWGHKESDMTERLNNTRNTHRNLESHTHVQGKTHAQIILEKTLNFHLRMIAKLKVSLDKCWNVLVQSPSAKRYLVWRGIWCDFLGEVFGVIFWSFFFSLCWRGIIFKILFNFLAFKEISEGMETSRTTDDKIYSLCKNRSAKSLNNRLQQPSIVKK